MRWQRTKSSRIGPRGKFVRPWISLRRQGSPRPAIRLAARLGASNVRFQRLPAPARLSTPRAEKSGLAVPLCEGGPWCEGRWPSPPGSRRLPRRTGRRQSPPVTSAGEPVGLRRRPSARRRVFFSSERCRQSSGAPRGGKTSRPAVGRAPTSAPGGRHRQPPGNLPGPQPVKRL